MSEQRKYRGKRVDGKGWAVGYFVPGESDTGYHYIIESCWYGSRHMEESHLHVGDWCKVTDVAHSTGKNDKNGDEIFEGMRVKLSYGIPPTYDILTIEYADDEVVADISVSGWWMRNTRPNGCSASLCKTYEGDLEILPDKEQSNE